MEKKTNFKEIMNGYNHVWVITDAKQGYEKKVRITAERRFYTAGEINRYQEWLSIDYVNRIRREHGYVKIQDSPFWRS